MGRCLAALIALLLSWASMAQVPTAGDAYQRVQSMRSEAGKMAADGKPEDLAKAAAHLEDALAFLSRSEIRELAQGSQALYYRGHDVRWDLAIVYARMGEKEKALGTLEAMQTLGWIGAVSDRFEGMKEVDSLRGDPRFDRIIERGRIASRLWKVPAIATPYKERLSVEERVAGLSLFWAEARQHFVYFDHVPQVAWDEVYMQFLTRVIAAETTLEYYRILMQLAPLLGDAHTNIYAPKEIQSKFYSRPPMRTRRIAGKVLVTEVPSATLAERVHVGDEIVAIDGVPVVDYAEREVRPFVSSSTPQDRELRMYTYQLLSGDADAPLRLRLRTASGLERDVELARKGYTDVQPPKLFRFEILDGGVAYLSVDHFESPEGLKAFEAALPRILEAKALLLDLRLNGGGSTQFGLEILSYLTDKPIPTATAMQRNDTGAQRNGVVRWTPVSGSGRPYVRKRDRHFEGPVAVLIGPQTFSAAEDFLLSFDALKRGIMVGEPSGGSTGQPLSLQLPGGGTARICVKRDSYPDGREFVGKGIAPTIPVTQTVEDFRAGRDVVLERAVAALQAR